MTTIEDGKLREINEIKLVAISAPLVVAYYEILGTVDSYRDMILTAVTEKAAQTAAGREAVFAPDMTLFWWGVLISLLIVGVAAFCGFKAWTRFSRVALWVLCGLVVLDLIWGVWAAIDGRFSSQSLILPAVVGLVLCARAVNGAHKLHRSAGASLHLHEAPPAPPAPRAPEMPQPEARPASAPAPAPAPAPEPTSHSLSSQDIERISRLSALHEAGKLTDAEYKRQKELILKGI